MQDNTASKNRSSLTSSTDVGQFRDDRWRVDAHVKILDDRVVARAKRRGLDVLVYAPHYTPLPEIRRRADRHSDDELLVVPARELFTGGWRNRKHVLAVGLDEPVPDFLTLSATMAELRRQEAAILAPHPAFFTFSLSETDLQEYRDAIHAAEPFNTKHWGYHNRRARGVVRRTDLPPFASSYAHLRSTIGEAWTAFERPIESESDLVAAFRDGAARSVCRRSGPGHYLRCRAEFAHVIWENTGQKLPRLLFDRTPATHPGRDIYDSRFKADSV